MGTTLFIPIVLTACGGFGPNEQKYLKHICGRARESSCSDVGVGQPAIQTTWSTPNAYTYWVNRFSVAGAAKDAQVKSDVLLIYFARKSEISSRLPAASSRC